MGEKEKVKVDPVPTEDPKDDKKKATAEKQLSTEVEVEDLTLEERKLKEDLDLMVERVCEKGADAELQKVALEGIEKEVRSSTSSMTAIPLPLKFLAPHYDAIKDAFKAMGDNDANKPFVADVLSVLSMVCAQEPHEMLSFKFKGRMGDIGNWGHEYVRALAGELGTVHSQRQIAGEDIADIEKLVDQVVPFNVKHNAEYEAVDLLMEVEMLHKLPPVITKDNHDRVCRYLLSCVHFIADTDEREKLCDITFNAYLEHAQLHDALRVAIFMGANGENSERIMKVFEATEDENIRKQLGYLLASQRIVVAELEDDDELMEVIGNVNLNQQFLSLAQELDVTEAKTPDDIYKSHLVESHGNSMSRRAGSGANTVDSAKQNLASTFVNAFVNCAFGNDTLITPEGSDWLYKNKTHGMLSAAASSGLILLWDVETGFSSADKYSHSAQNYIKAGGLLATGMLNSNICNPEMDAAYALLSEHVESNDKDMKTAAVFGLGLAYAGTARDDILEILVPVIVDSSQGMEIVSLTCLALGLVYVGTANAGIAESVVEAFLDRSDTDLRDSMGRMMCLGFGLLYLGCGEKCEEALEMIKSIKHPISGYLATTIQTCAYAGTANVLQIQKLIQLASQHIKVEDDDEEEKEAGKDEKKDDKKDNKKEGEEEKEDLGFKAKQQEVAILGLAVIAMGEDLSSDMMLRTLDHILQHGEVNLRRVLPLALGLLSVSNPQLPIMDSLSKLSHDQDQIVSQNAVFALGLIGAGTNNSRIAAMLRQLVAYYAKEPNHLFLVRIAQGLLHLGKGLMSLSPFSSDGLLMSKVSMAALLIVLHASLDMKNTILSHRHYLLYGLVGAIHPRMLITLDEEGNSIPVSVRVGQAVDISGQAGKPKSITGFQTHTTPVLLSAGDRAELATDEYLTLTRVLEGFVIVKVNPDSKDAKEKAAREQAEEEKKAKK